jgi:hypothetical protein
MAIALRPFDIARNVPGMSKDTKIVRYKDTLPVQLPLKLQLKFAVDVEVCS